MSIDFGLSSGVVLSGLELYSIVLIRIKVCAKFLYTLYNNMYFLYSSSAVGGAGPRVAVANSVFCANKMHFSIN